MSAADKPSSALIVHYHLSAFFTEVGVILVLCTAESAISLASEWSSSRFTCRHLRGVVCCQDSQYSAY